MFNVDEKQQQSLDSVHGAELAERLSGIHRKTEIKTARTCRARAFAFFSFETENTWLSSNPKLFFYAAVYQLINVLLIVASILNLVVSTDPVIWATPWLIGPQLAVFCVDTITVAFFVFDYVVRILTCPNVLLFVVNPFNVVDLAIIIPYFVEVGLNASGNGGSKIQVLYILKLLRIVRVLRLFRFGRYSGLLNSVWRGISKSADAVVLGLVLLSIFLVFNSSLVFFAEQTGEIFNSTTKQWVYTQTGDISPFQSIYATFWWCFTTLTFLGYGDELPQTPLGRTVVVFTMVCAVFSFVVPIYVILCRINVEVMSYGETKATRELSELPSHELLLRVFALNQDLNQKIGEMRKTQKTLGLLLYKLGKHSLQQQRSDLSGAPTLGDLGAGQARMFAQTTFLDNNESEESIEAADL